MMIKTVGKRLGITGAVWLCIAGGTTWSDVSDIAVLRDASIYSEPAPLANGSGEFLFAGVNGSNNSENMRRSMLYFDITAALPVNAVVTSATLRLNVDREPFGASPTEASLHAAESDWGEGPTNPTGPEGTGAAAQFGDATWTQSFHTVTDWTTAGGDFDASASDTETISGLGLVFFSSPEMANDVQSWYDTPSQNYGWFLLIDETDTRNARRFTSGEDSDLESIIPLLSVGYTIVPEPGALSLFVIGSLLLHRSRSRFRIL